MIRRIFKIFRYKTCGFNRRVELLRRDGVKIGKNCEIYANVSFGSEPYLIEIGDNVRITDGVSLTTHDGGIFVLRNMGKLPNADKFGKIRIGNNVHIGIKSIIMPGVTIGDNVVIGAGSIVTKDIPSNSVAVGIPCKVIESIEDYYEKSKDCVLYTKDKKSQEKRNILEEKYK